MSSIVAELLQPTGKLVKENILLKVDDLKTKLEVLKLEVHETLKHKYVNFYPQYIKLGKLMDRVKEIGDNYESIHNQIEKEIKPLLGSSAAELHDVVEDLKKIKILKSFVCNLGLLHQHLESAKEAKSQFAYLIAAYRLIDFENVFKEIDASHKKDIVILSALKTEFYVIKERIIYDSENIWRQNIVINSNIEGKNKKCITISINKELSSYEEIFKTLYLLNCLKPVFKEFGRQFLKHVCDTLIMNTVKISMNETHSILTIDILNEQSPQPSEVFEKLKDVFYFIHGELFKLPVSENFEISAMNEFGDSISEDFYTLIIDKCLKFAIPKQSKQLEAFHKEILTAENFCNYLQDIGFFSRRNNLLLNFIKNVDILPINKMAQDILSRARLLIKSSLHQTVTVGVESIPVIEVENCSHDLNEMAGTKSGLSRATLLYPKCQISSSVKELVKLLQEVKDEAKNIGPTHAPRLYYVARSICELYCCVAPTFHKEEIRNIPQQTAIFHNNCMYLAHVLCTLGNYYECELQVEIPITFIDLVPEVRKLGIESFLYQMRQQKEQLLQLIQEQQAYQSVMIDEGIINKAEKSIKQCLCQLQLLQKVWSEILPTAVYFKAIGTLFNTCLEEIILRVLAMEDISEDAAAQMDSIFGILLKQGPDLFKITNIDMRNSVHTYIKRWFKFQELQLIMSASLQEIVDRWASGKGPLAAHFTEDDVKHLIRALFQNTERRAAALAKIR